MPPEVVMYGNVTPAMGCTVIELLTGQRPYSDWNPDHRQHADSLLQHRFVADYGVIGIGSKKLVSSAAAAAVMNGGAAETEIPCCLSFSYASS
ncbi:unnamed protein product [Linum tenue]|uniref:Uncharacterized protein n=1 Tax=Linum tenue TaxID=586396 RepID=A0AAV0H6M5_9ROSI|nr:unnamed protein product [Linum tenue]